MPPGRHATPNKLNTLMKTASSSLIKATLTLLIAGAFALVGFGQLQAADAAAAFKADPAKVLGAENCKECHAPIFEAWEKTHHFLSFAAGTGDKPAMHRSDEAKAILKKMGERSAKRGACVQCHYTGQASDTGRVKTISGTSCESCHGGGKDWNKVHSNKEDPMALAKSEPLGMIRPHMTYAVAANCFTCHTVPNEELVNKGGHTAGSAFELVSWSQGEVRHNLQKTEGKSNPEASAGHKRMLYVVGRLLDLEFGLRGLASATADGAYSQAMIKRVQSAKAKLGEIASADKAIGDIAALVDDGALKAGNAAALKATADKISQASQAFSQANDGTKLAAIDSKIPGPDQYKGKAHTP